MNYWPEYIEFWHGASLGIRDTDLFIWSTWGHK